MLNWKSTDVLVSRFDQDIRITFRRFTQRHKGALELELAEYRAEVRDRMLDYAETCIDDRGLRDNDANLVVGEDNKPIHPGDSDYVRAQKQTRRTAFDQWLQGHVERYLKPATLRTYVQGIEGLTIDGEPCRTAEGLLDGPEEIATEAYAHILAHGGLSEADSKNSPSPSTLPAAEGGSATPTIADPAGTPAS